MMSLQRRLSSDLGGERRGADVQVAEARPVQPAVARSRVRRTCSRRRRSNRWRASQSKSRPIGHVALDHPELLDHAAGRTGRRAGRCCRGRSTCGRRPRSSRRDGPSRAPALRRAFATWVRAIGTNWRIFSRIAWSHSENPVVSNSPTTSIRLSARRRSSPRSSSPRSLLEVVPVRQVEVLALDLADLLRAPADEGPEDLVLLGPPGPASPRSRSAVTRARFTLTSSASVELSSDSSSTTGIISLTFASSVVVQLVRGAPRRDPCGRGRCRRS